MSSESSSYFSSESSSYLSSESFPLSLPLVGLMGLLPIGPLSLPLIDSPGYSSY